MLFVDNHGTNEVLWLAVAMYSCVENAQNVGDGRQGMALLEAAAY